MKPTFIHPSAICDEGARIGKGVQVWHFSHLMPGCIIGDGCNIGMNVFIDNNVSLGSGVKVQNNVSIYNGAVLEDDVFIGPSAVFTNVINPRSFIERKSEFKPTVIRKGATIGANVTLVCGIEVGEYAFIGAGTVVTKNVLPYSLVVGNPGRHVGWMSERGERLEFDIDNCVTCKGSGEQYILNDGKVSKKR